MLSIFNLSGGTAQSGRSRCSIQAEPLLNFAGRADFAERCTHPAADLTVQPLDHIVGADARPMLAGKIAVSQSFLNAVLDLLGSVLQFHGAQLGDHGLRLLAGRFLALLGVDRLEHFCHNFDLGFGHNRENIAVEMHRAALVFGVREHLTHGLQHPHALVADDELHAIQAASAEPLEEADPTGLVLLHALGSAQNFTKPALIYGDCHQNSNIFVLSAPVAAQVDTVHVDVWIVPALQWAVAPVLDVDVGFLVQLADDGGLEGHALESGDVERNVAGGREMIRPIVLIIYRVPRKPS